MYLTQQTDFALRVLLYLVVNRNELVKIGTIASTYNISHSHLMKVVTSLVKGGFVVGVRGKGGGLKLARPPDQIKIGEVIRHMEPMDFIDCRSGKGYYCILHGSCKLSSIIRDASTQFLEYLDKFDLEWVVRESGGLDLIDESSEIYRKIHGAKAREDRKDQAGGRETRSRRKCQAPEGARIADILQRLDVVEGAADDVGNGSAEPADETSKRRRGRPKKNGSG